MNFVNIPIPSTVDTRTGFATKNPVLENGDFGLEIDTLNLKIGDGETAWDELEYAGNLILGEGNIVVPDDGGDGQK